MIPLARLLVHANDRTTMPPLHRPPAANRGSASDATLAAAGADTERAAAADAPTVRDDVPRAAALWSQLHAELHRLAHGLLRRERADHTLQTTALVHEAWLRLGADESWGGRGRFLAAAARAMRCILVDHARAHNRHKRSGGRTSVSLDASGDHHEGTTATAFAIADAYGQVVDLLALDAALDRLAESSELAARIVELRFFAGMSHEEIAAACGVSLRTVERNFRFARACLYRELSERSS
jgi:RNA polymerase sigma-70 factor, ECF subfamily